MTEIEIGKLLTIAASYDNRNVSRETVTAWYQLLKGFTYAEAQEALLEHFANSTDYLMPAHIVSGIKRKRGYRALSSHVAFYCMDHWYPSTDCPKCEEKFANA